MKKLVLSRQRDILSLMIALAIFLSVLSCGKIKSIFEGDETEKQSEQVTESDAPSESDQSTDNQNDKDLTGKTQSNRLNLIGTYGGTFHERKFEIVIKEVNGKNITGYNVAYWTDPPYRTNMTGTYDESTGEIVLYEDKNEKEAGLFDGILSTDGKTMKGTYSPYTSKKKYKWSVSKDGYVKDDLSSKKELPFKDFAKEYVKKAPASKNYYLSHSQNTINVIYTEGGMQTSSNKKLSAGSYYDEYKTTASICKGIIGNNMINYRQLVEDGSGYYDGHFEMYFKKDSNGNWILYKIDDLVPN